MSKIKNTTLSAVLLMLSAGVAEAGVLDRPAGIVVGQHMTLRPYVAVSATFDSNPDSRHDDQKEDVMWSISPGLGVSYNAENWSLLLDAFYNYRAYCRNTSSNYANHNHHTFGEDLRWNWSNSKGTEKGWSLMLSENYQQINMCDDMEYNNGQSYNADRRQFQANGVAQRRFNEHWHSDLNAGIYLLDYDNDESQKTSALYGWERVHVGLDAGFAPSPWTDFLVSGGYQIYEQENARGSQTDRTSQGFTLQGGIGSYMTERISYRLLGGWSRFQYGDNAKGLDGFVYTASGNWKIGETWNTMLLASSYYQPSEREYNTASRVDAISWGLAKSMVRGKLRGTLDLRYRRETQEHVNSSLRGDYTLDIITARLGISYVINRIVSLFAYGEYQKSWNDEAAAYNYAQDYDRWRLTAGMRFTY